MELTLEEYCEELRQEIKKTADKVFALRNHQTFEGEQGHANQHSEMQANIMLTYRHLEDARMRVGKIMQAIQGGVSILDK